MALIKNTLSLGLVIFFYYLTVIIIQYLFGLFSTIPVLDTWRATWGDPAWTFWQFFIYLGIPVIIAIAFIVTTKPESESIYLRRRFG